MTYLFENVTIVITILFVHNIQKQKKYLARASKFLRQRAICTTLHFARIKHVNSENNIISKTSAL